MLRQPVVGETSTNRVEFEQPQPTQAVNPGSDYQHQHQHELDKESTALLGAVRRVVQSGERVIFLQPTFAVAAIPLPPSAGGQRTTVPSTKDQERDWNQIVGPLFNASQQNNSGTSPAETLNGRSASAASEAGDPQPAICLMTSGPLDRLIPLSVGLLKKHCGRGLEHLMSAQTVEAGLQLLSLVTGGGTGGGGLLDSHDAAGHNNGAGMVSGFSIDVSTKVRVNVLFNPAAPFDPYPAARCLALAPASELEESVGPECVAWLRSLTLNSSTSKASSSSSAQALRFAKWSEFRSMVARIVPQASDTQSLYRTIATLYLASELRLVNDLPPDADHLHDDERGYDVATGRPKAGVMRPATHRDRDALLVLGPLLGTAPNLLLDTARVEPEIRNSAHAPSVVGQGSQIWKLTGIVEELRSFIFHWLLGALNARLSTLHVVATPHVILALRRNCSGVPPSPPSTAGGDGVTSTFTAQPLPIEELFSNLAMDHVALWCSRVLGFPHLKAQCKSVEFLAGQSRSLIPEVLMPDFRYSKKLQRLSAHGTLQSSSTTTGGGGPQLRADGDIQLMYQDGYSHTDPQSLMVKRSSVDGSSGLLLAVKHTFGSVCYWPLRHTLGAESIEASIQMLGPDLATLFEGAIASKRPLFVECLSASDALEAAGSDLPTSVRHQQQQVLARSLSLALAVVKGATAPSIVHRLEISEFCSRYFQYVDPHIQNDLSLLHRSVERLRDEDFVSRVCHDGLGLPVDSWLLDGSSVCLTGLAVRHLAMLAEVAQRKARGEYGLDESEEASGEDPQRSASHRSASAQSQLSMGDNVRSRSAAAEELHVKRTSPQRKHMRKPPPPPARTTPSKISCGARTQRGSVTSDGGGPNTVQIPVRLNHSAALRNLNTDVAQSQQNLSAGGSRTEKRPTTPLKSREVNRTPGKGRTPPPPSTKQASSGGAFQLEDWNKLMSGRR